MFFKDNFIVFFLQLRYCIVIRSEQRETLFPLGNLFQQITSARVIIRRYATSVRVGEQEGCLKNTIKLSLKNIRSDHDPL